MKKKQATAFILPRRAIIGLGITLISLVILYTYFIMFSIFHVVAREDAIRTTEALSDRVSMLERQYLEKSQRLTEAYARSLGFVAPSSRQFIERTTVAVSVASGNAR